MKINKKVLIVNADDYGLTPAVSKGIRDGFSNGIITSTTVLMSGSSVKEDIVALKTECRGIGIGIHLALTTFSPMSDRATVRSLLNDDGNFYSLDLLLKQAKSINKEEVYHEWKNQIIGLQNLGVLIDHLDSHHHACFLSEETIRITADLALEFNLPVRTPVSPSTTNNLVPYAYKMFKKEKIRFPDAVVLDFTKQKGKVDLLESIVGNLNDGVTEIVTHAGLVDTTLRRLSSLVESREIELHSLKAPVIKQIVTSDCIELSSFGEAFQ